MTMNESLNHSELVEDNMFLIRVQTNSEYKYIREDYWGTPVRTNVQSEAKLFETVEAAIEYAGCFMLVSTHYVHEIVENEVVKITCQYGQNSKGKWVLDAKAVK